MEQLFAILRHLQIPPDGLLDRLSSFLTEKQYKKKEFLLREGQVSDKLFFIKQGIIRGYWLEESKEELTSWFMLENDFAFSVESFYDQLPADENIEALEDTVVLYITYDQLETLYKEFPTYNFHGRVLTQKYYKLSIRRDRDKRRKTAHERYQLFLEREPHLVNRVPLQDIASYLGMTQAMLSKVRSEINIRK
jgi:CRP/FNR family transcriptional regulator, anaerobic regulatory protein